MKKEKKYDRSSLDFLIFSSVFHFFLLSDLQTVEIADKVVIEFIHTPAYSPD